MRCSSRGTSLTRSRRPPEDNVGCSDLLSGFRRVRRLMREVPLYESTEVTVRVFSESDGLVYVG